MTINNDDVQPMRDAEFPDHYFRTVIEHSLEGILVLDTTGTIVYANKSTAQLMEYPSTEQLLHVPLRDILSQFVITDETGQVLSASEYPAYQILAGQQPSPPCMCQFLPDRLNDIHDNFVEESISQACMGFVNTRTGRQWWTTVWSWPVMNAQGRVSLVISLFHDVTEFKALEERKDAFMSKASHELRTPLTTLGVLIEIMHGQLTVRQDEQMLLLLDRIENQLERITYIVNKLLDLSDIQAGNMVLHMEPLDLSAVLHEVVDMLQRATPSHQLIVECPSKMQVVGDKGRIRLVVLNLLTNAIKYSPDANQVRVRAVTEPDWIYVSVQDFGVGIAEEHLPHVFERFYQIAEPIEKTFPGLGISLYMCSEMIKQHHGFLWVESQKGQGSTFSFALPVATRVPSRVER